MKENAQKNTKSAKQIPKKEYYSTPEGLKELVLECNTIGHNFYDRDSI